MKIDVQALLDILPKAGRGYLGIFIVTAIIILAISLISVVFDSKGNNNQQ